MKPLQWFVVLSAVFFRPLHAQEVELYFPNVVSGQIGSVLFNDVFVWANDGNQQIEIQFDVLTNQGTLAEASLIQVGAGEVESVGTYSWMPFLWPTLPRQVQGWGRVRLAEGSPLRARQNLSVRNYDESFRTIATANSRAVAAGRVLQVTLPDIVTWFDPVHAIALVNPSSETAAQVQVDFDFHGAGSLVPYLVDCQTGITVSPLHRVARFLQDDLCHRGPQRGWPPAQVDLTFSSDEPIAVSVMEYSPSTYGFSDLEVRKLE